MTGLSALQLTALKDYLDKIVDRANHVSFIENDPISIPHQYSKLQDIEIAAFFTATLSWGNRKTIINKSKELMSLMDNQPYDFILHHSERDLQPLSEFKHRTFQGIDTLVFIKFLKLFYQENDSLEQAFYPNKEQKYNAQDALTGFYNLFISTPDIPIRTRKHIPTPIRKSACKRLNMLLRWMVRLDDRGVDFGLWQTIPTSALMIPLDVHVERYARKFGLLTRKPLDWQAVEEITQGLRLLNPDDPVVYDFALFGLGVLDLEDFVF